MGLWSAYFLAKLLLYARGDSDFSPWLNLGFAVFTALTPGNSRQRFAKNLIALPVGGLLLYHDLPLPPLTQITPLYLAGSIYHGFSWQWMAGVIVLAACYSLARRKLRLETFVFIAISWVTLAPSVRLFEPAAADAVASNRHAIAAPQADPTQDADPRAFSPQALDQRLARFYLEEGKQRIRFNRPADDGAPFDILILQLSSLSWDDLRTIRREQDPLFGRFDIVFSQFNSASSDAAAARIRWLRGGCGQTLERQLFDPPPPDCSIIEALQRAGFEPHWLANVPADRGSLDSVRRQGALPAPDTVAGAQVTQKTADGEPVFGDYSMLSRWAARRAALSAARVVLYYNSESLNDSNRQLKLGHGAFPYAERWATFSADVNHFIDDLQQGGRHAIVLVMAEHGAALRGDRQQMPGLREIPTASIVRVPVGVILVNVARSPQWVQARIDVPSSYIAVGELLSRFIADNPFGQANLTLLPYITGLPQTDLVAENNGITVMQTGSRQWMRSPDGTWSTLDE